jgi:hypothetical protein
MNSSFSKNLPSLQLAWDATSLDLLKQCPRKYYYTMILGFSSAEQNIHLEFGLLYHKALEEYQYGRSKGWTHATAQFAMVRSLLASTWLPPGKPWFTGDTYKNRLTLLRSAIWHTEQYQEDAFETIQLQGKPALELSFQYQTGIVSTSTREPFLLCGHIDRLGTLNGLPFGLDYKTTKYDVSKADYFNFYSPDNQMSMYSLAGKVVYKTEIQGMIVDAAQVQVGGTRFRRGFAPRTESQIDEWYRELIRYWIPLAERCVATATWPQNDTACGRYGGCQFRSICGKSPEVREQWLKSTFKPKVWDPLRVRGDV